MMVRPPGQRITERRAIDEQHQGGKAPGAVLGQDRFCRPGHREAGEGMKGRCDGDTRPQDRAVHVDAKPGQHPGRDQDHDVERPGPMQRQAIGRAELGRDGLIPIAVAPQFLDADQAHIGVGIQQAAAVQDRAVIAKGDMKRAGREQQRDDVEQTMAAL